LNVTLEKKPATKASQTKKQQPKKKQAPKKQAPKKQAPKKRAMKEGKTTAATKKRKQTDEWPVASTTDEFIEWPKDAIIQTLVEMKFEQPDIETWQSVIVLPEVSYC
jgi:hypothetical protein